ncbi:MAG: hypothetical protein ACREJO_11355 [Phycisphaerales bacterium]
MITFLEQYPMFVPSTSTDMSALGTVSYKFVRRALRVNIDTQSTVTFTIVGIPDTLGLMVTKPTYSTVTNQALELNDLVVPMRSGLGAPHISRLSVPSALMLDEGLAPNYPVTLMAPNHSTFDAQSITATHVRPVLIQFDRAVGGTRP